MVLICKKQVARRCLNTDKIMIRYSLKELIDGLSVSVDAKQTFKYEMSSFVAEAKRGVDWTQWNEGVFEHYFENNHNCVAKLGNGQMSKAEKAALKAHWNELAPHLKTIAESQDVPLWNEYREVKDIIIKYARRNVNVAANRILAGLQPNLLCSECDITRLNKLVEYLRMFTDADISSYDPTNWEKASFFIFKLFKTVSGSKDYWDIYYLPWRLLAECENRFGSLPRKWLVFANREMWHHAEALHELGFVSWTMHRTNFSVGDIVYLFMSDERRVRFMTRVVEENCVRGDEKYRVDRATSTHLTYKLEFVAESMNDGLKEENLKHHGFNGGRSIQHPMHNNPELFEYIAPYFDGEVMPLYDEIPNPESVFEGAIKEVVVNRYERSWEAREKCIAINGCKCSVCGIDFEKFYGEIGRGFIHVHHIVPISTIGEEYQLNPIKDLVPVCPNCHAMLHRGLGGKVLSVKELKDIVEKRKT